MKAPESAIPLGRSGYLMLRRDGGVWGIANSSVTSLARQGRGDLGAGGPSPGAYRVGTEGLPLAADEILGVAADLEVRPPARAVARWWPAGSDGCAVWSGLPVALIDPRQPPLALRVPQQPEGEPHGD